MGIVSVLSVSLLFRLYVPVGGSGGPCVSSRLPGYESTGERVSVGGQRRVWLQGARAWQPPAAFSEALSPMFSANFKQLLHLSKSSLGDWPGKEQQRIKRLHFQTTSQPPARNWTLFAV